jgi:hypothetical protein
VVATSLITVGNLMPHICRKQIRLNDGVFDRDQKCLLGIMSAKLFSRPKNADGNEPEAPTCAHAIENSTVRRASAANFVEAAVIGASRDPIASRSGSPTPN